MDKKEKAKTIVLQKFATDHFRPVTEESIASLGEEVDESLDQSRRRILHLLEEVGVILEESDSMHAPVLNELLATVRQLVRCPEEPTQMSKIYLKHINKLQTRMQA